MEASAGLLHHRTRHDVFIGLPQFDQLSEAALHDAGRPFVHVRLAVVVSAQHALDALFDNVLRLLRVERTLAAVLILLHSGEPSLLQAAV